MNKDIIEGIIKRNGFEDFKWISGKDVEVRQWVRFKCMFGCGSYGQKGACPPEVPPVGEYQRLFSEYEHIAVIHITGRVANLEDRARWSRSINLDLVNLKRDVFLAGNTDLQPVKKQEPQKTGLSDCIHQRIRLST